MSKKGTIPTYKGRIIGILILTSAQLFVGAIHVFFGFLLLSFEPFLMNATVAYDIYTITFGLLISLFAVLIWSVKKMGWIGTIIVSSFVIAVDILSVLNLPSIPGIPKFAAPGEIGYSIIIIFYMLQGYVRKIYFSKK